VSSPVSAIGGEGSVCTEAAVDWQRHAEHEARGRAAQSESRRGDLVGAALRPIG